jgi:membrane protease YdiL (CAAX protease family)
MNEPLNAEDPFALPSVVPVESTDHLPDGISEQDVLAVLPAEVEQPNFVLEWLKGGHPFLAWLLIACLVIGIPILRNWRTSEDPAGPENHLRLVVFTMQAKVMVGLHSLLRDPSVVQQASTMDVGSIDQRLGYVALVGELAGPKAAQDKLAALNSKILGSGYGILPRDAMAIETLQRLYTNYQEGVFDDPAIDESQRENLRTMLGWVGELALAPPGGPNEATRQDLLHSAQVVCFVFGSAFVVGVILGIAGVVGLMILCFYMFSSPGRSGVRAGEGSGGIYAETFALWMFIFLFFGIASQFIHVEGAEMLVAGLVNFSTLIVLVWPVLRGIPWRQVREDVGLIGGRRPILEPFLGPVGYVISLPLLCVGVLLMLGMIRLQGLFAVNWTALLPMADEFSPTSFPAHPIVEHLARPGLSGKLQILFLGSVVAPIVEEIMFRGVLYRHLRNATGAWSFFWSCLFSGLLVSFVFAVIHPQGILAVPALMALAMGFTLMRQWRGSLSSCIVAHGLNNALVMSLAAFLFAS